MTKDGLCAVQSRGRSAGANFALSLPPQPVAIGAAAETTKWLKPPAYRVIKVTWRAVFAASHRAALMGND